MAREPDQADQPPETRPLHAEIPTELHKRMGRYRAETGVTLTKQVERWVDEGLTEEGY